MADQRLRRVAHQDGVERLRDVRVRLIGEDVRDFVVPHAIT